MSTQGNEEINAIRTCPFCGLSPSLWEGAVGWRVSCVGDTCRVQPCTHGYKRRQAAIEAWNMREPEERR